MTNAPANLLAVRTLLLQHLNPKPTKQAADLESDEVGIVGDPKHRGGYHCGKDRVDSDDYSVRESSRDRNGLTLDAAALDVGWFELRVGGKTHNLRTFSIWAVAQCKARKPDTHDIREIIYSTDGKTVKRWDALGKRTTGDSSHLSHTHFSFYRDAIKAGRDQTALFRRYLDEIGLLEDDDMTPEQANLLARIDRNTSGTNWAVGRGVPSPAELKTDNPWTALTFVVPVMLEYLRQIAAKSGVDQDEVQAITAGVAAALPSADDVVAGVLAGLSPEAIAAAIPSTLAKQVTDELAKRIAE